MPLQTERGRMLLVVDDRGWEPRVGERLVARGLLTEPEPWWEAYLRRLGIRLELRADMATAVGSPRAGPAGLLDRIRSRSEVAVSSGLDPPQAALALGFVLGQDDRIDGLTREQFRRSGLAHLLAVSGQNVMLLAILAGIIFAFVGVGPRARLVLILGLIAIYVPVAGAGPSIQRAAVMGAAGIVAGLAGRTTDRAYLPLLAACATLTLNPLSAGDVGWQLSFAAVIGIALWSAPIAALLRERLAPTPERRRRLAGPLAEGAGLTIAATLATGPLMAYHFETVSLASLPANLLVLPAVPPVMWLGMLAAIAGQLPLIPTAPLALVEGPLLDYIAAVARVFAAADWAVIELPSPSAPGLGLIYAGLLAGVGGAIRTLERRRRIGFRGGAAALASAVVALLLVRFVLAGGDGSAQPAPGSLRLTAIDVGQGDAILLQQRGAPAALVDTGPPGAGLSESLRGLGVERLGIVFITHDQRDHAGAIGDVLAAAPVERLALARPAPAIAAEARAAGVEVIRVAEGSEVALDGLRLQVLSPGPGPTLPAARPERGLDRARRPVRRLDRGARRRRRGRGDDDRSRPGRSAQGRPPRQCRRRARRPARPQRTAGGDDQRRRRERLRAPDGRDPGHPGRARDLRAPHRPAGRRLRRARPGRHVGRVRAGRGAARRVPGRARLRRGSVVVRGRHR